MDLNENKHKIIDISDEQSNICNIPKKLFSCFFFTFGMNVMSFEQSYFVILEDSK